MARFVTFCFVIHTQAVRTYGREIHMTEFLNKLDFYILPVFNIDGYVHTWTKVLRVTLRDAEPGDAHPFL